MRNDGEMKDGLEYPIKTNNLILIDSVKRINCVDSNGGHLYFMARKDRLSFSSSVSLLRIESMKIAIVDIGHHLTAR
jgi:hypothetical protein